jgi:hypothetical protein
MAVLTGGVLKLKQVRFADKQQSNNKLDMEELEGQPARRTKLIEPMRKIIRQLAPDLIVGVPRTGQDWAVEIGAVEGIAVPEIEKDLSSPNTFRFATNAARLLVAQAKVIVVVEDATTRRTNERGMYASLPGLQEKTVACVTGWARDLPEERYEVDVPLYPIIEEYIPYELASTHPSYQYAVTEEAA